MRKVVLTESQIKTLLQEERLTLMLQEAIEEGADEASILRKIKTYLAAGVSALAIIAAVTNSTLPNITKQHIITHVRQKAQQKEQEPEAQASQLDTAGYAQKVQGVKKYMETALKNQGYSMKSTKLKPETLVNASMETGFDLPFLLAAAHQESCFGATPRAQRTNSVFSVGSYDNGKNVKVYADPNDSVSDYIDLMNRRYLGDEKSITDLLEPGCFVNDQGNRYASDKKYEGKIKQLRNSIIKKYPDLA